MRSIAAVLVGVLLCPTVFEAGAQASPMGVLEWAAQQQDRQFNRVPHEVLAFYYTWYGRPERHGRWVHWGGEDAAAHEIPASTHYPARGAYDSQDPMLIDAHIAQAKAHGLTGFIATWWGQGTFEDQAFRLLLDAADTNAFKVTVYWETAPGEGGEQIEQAVGDLAYVVGNYGARPSYLKVDDVPVIFVYGRVMDQIPLESWPAIVRGARARVGDFLLIADGYRESYTRLFDGVHTYNNCGEVAGKSPDALRRWAAAHYSNAVAVARAHGKISCVTVIPGYDDTKIRKPGLNAARQGGQTYRVLWEEAISADPDWVLITSWNEWHEGSEIEPSWEDGEQYVNLTAGYAPRFGTGPPVTTAHRQKASPDQGNAGELRTRFEGRPIGVLPGFGEAAFWLLDAGVSLQELNWADLVDPSVVNPQTFPLLFHAGGEHYLSRARRSGDVLPALQRYLAGGGFLVSMPHQPFPFYYDDSAGRPNVIAHLIGFPIQQGWEVPPMDAKLTFRFNTNELSGLPVTAPFPRTGDLRWRPATRVAAGDADVYVPLASLTDQDGRALGEGIVYVEHQEPPLAGGRTLYVWMRMGDVVGEDELMSAVFRYVEEHLGR